jgi:dATP pyrophosphohydrolase
MWLATRSAEGWHCLMLLRSPDHGSFWQGVSGRAEPGDETLRATARRELLEETGIAAGARILDLGTWTTFQSAFSERWYRKRAIGVVLPAGTGPEGVTLSIEHVEARLVTFEEARALVRWPGNAEALEALERRVRSMS